MTPEEIDALQAGPEMDRLVAERVMGWKEGEPHKHGQVASFSQWVEPEHRYCSHSKNLPGWDDSPDSADIWSPSIDLNHAMEAVQDRALTLTRYIPENAWTAVVAPRLAYIGCGLVSYAAAGETPMLAICRALLKAVEEKW
jgi:hypothetical protein